MRKRIFEIVELSKDGDTLSSVYDAVMVFFIVVSIAPLLYKEDIRLFYYTDIAAAAVFIIDYCLRWITADHKLGQNLLRSFIKYPFTPMAVIDLLSILPFVSYLGNGYRLLRVVRILKPLRIFRVFRTLRYSGSMGILMKVMRNSKKALMEVAVLAAGYIFVSAVTIFTIEPGPFESFFDAVYWATVSLTTVGYGDIYPETTIGRTIAMISSLFGIAIVALPSGIVTAGYIAAISETPKDQR